LEIILGFLENSKCKAGMLVFVCLRNNDFGLTTCMEVKEMDRKGRKDGWELDAM
jgi:hypothetical protein